VWREIRLVSVVIVPIKSHRREHGALTLGFGLSERHYGSAELQLFSDIGLRVALALDTAHLVRELETEHRRKDEFLAMLAHELRNPLAAVTNALAALDHAAGDERAHLARILGRQSEHLAHLVNDLLDVSRIKFGMVALHRQRLDLRDVTRNAVEVVRAQRESERLSISVRVGPEPVMVDGDPDRLDQVFNLLDNAVGTLLGGNIDVGAVGGESAVVHVRDSGVGSRWSSSRDADVFAREPRPRVPAGQAGLAA
jgi:signal transduction histidine kinase